MRAQVAREIEAQKRYDAWADRVADVFYPLTPPARYKGAHGGRGSGKSHFFAEMMVEKALREHGFRGLCIREVQKALRDSAKKLIEDKIQTLGVGKKFDVQKELIVTPGGGSILFQGMQDHTAESVKSLEGFDVAWVEEAQALSAFSLDLLTPTIRKAGSEIWFSWNPRRKNDPVEFLRKADADPRWAVVEANWRDNPHFYKTVLPDERERDQATRPDVYEHKWEGGYAQVTEGAYFAEQLTLARQQNRISTVVADPLMQMRAFWDIGVRDHTAIWIAQFVGREIRVLDYYEAGGQPLGVHLSWLRARGYGDALCVLPHDGAHADQFTATRYEDHVRAAGFEVTVVKNQGKGAAMQRVETARRLFPRIWFNRDTTEAGVDALSAYHERRDDKREIGLGPEHDWSSHGSDAFGLMCVAYDEPTEPEPVSRVGGYRGASAWMG